MQYKHFKGYSVSADGTVINVNTVRQVKPQENNCGYMRVQLCHGIDKPRFFVHRIVAELYLSNPLNLPQVNHLDGNKKNNHVSNLEWCDASRNQKHSFSDLGKKPIRVCGDANGKTKIIKEQIEQARLRRESGELLKDIAAELDVNRKYLGALLNGRCNRHG